MIKLHLCFWVLRSVDRKSKENEVKKTEENLGAYMKSKEMTPMMKEYVKTKEQYKDCILFYSLGDFYEMFFEDAKTGIQGTGTDPDRKRLRTG